MRSFGLPGNVPLPHKKTKTVVRLAKNQNGCPHNGIRQWSHDLHPCFSALIGRPEHEGQLKKTTTKNICFDANTPKHYKKEYNIQIIESTNVKYRIYNPRAFENPIEKLVLAHSFLYRIFKLPRVLCILYFTSMD